MEDIVHKIGEQFRKMDRRRGRVLGYSVERFGLYRGQHLTLMTLRFFPGITQCDLAKKMDISPAAVAVNLKKLEKLNYIHREMDVEDNRYNQIYLTEKGEHVVNQSVQTFDQKEEEMYGFLSEEKQQILLEILEKINEHLCLMENDIKEERRKKTE